MISVPLYTQRRPGCSGAVELGQLGWTPLEPGHQPNRSVRAASQIAATAGCWTRLSAKMANRWAVPARFPSVLDRLCASGGHSHLILVGNPRITVLIRDHLPKRLSAKLIDVIMSTLQDRTSDVVVATLSSFVEHEQQESLETARLLVEELQRGGLAVAGTTATVNALESGQVDMLVMAQACDPPPGLRCRDCGAIRHGDVPPAQCPHCSSGQLRKVDIKEEIVRIGEQQGVEVEIVRNSDALVELDGIGCLLRYLTPEQRINRQRLAKPPTVAP